MKRIAIIIEKLESANSILNLPMSADLHLTAIRGLLPEIKEELKEAYLDLGGENFWEEGE